MSLFRSPQLRAAFVALAPLVLVGCGGGNGNKGGGQTQSAEKVEIAGQGATFVEPIMKFWVDVYGEKTEGNVRVNYQGTGSGAGIGNMTKKISDFGCSDAPMNKKQTEEAAKTGAVVHVPLVIGAVVPMYRLDGIDKPIAFSGPVLADIFMGKITKWNDKALQDLNADQPLPDVAINPVFREDPSGTSFIFTDYLSKVSEEFKKNVGAKTEPNWPSVGIKKPKSDGVAGHVTATNGAIGYIELTYALDKKAKFGAVVNQSKKPVLASLESITAAAAASLDLKQTAEPYSLHDLTYNLTNAPGENSYPIAGMSFAVLYQKQSGAKGKAVVDFLKWATGADAQAIASKRNYAPLPAELQKKCAEKLGTVELAQ